MAMDIDSIIKVLNHRFRLRNVHKLDRALESPHAFG